MGHRGRTSLVNRSPSAGGVVAGAGAKEPWRKQNQFIDKLFDLAA